MRSFRRYEFAEECEVRPRRIRMYKKGEKSVPIEYTLTIRGRRADLDYGGVFEAANKRLARAIYIGVSRITFVDDSRTAVKSVEWKEKGSRSFVDYEPAVSWPARADISTGPFAPPKGDRRRRALLSSVLRPGQMRFRAALLEAYETRCAISGCDVPAALEAAHVMPYRGNEFNHVQNGILMRADL